MRLAWRWAWRVVLLAALMVALAGSPRPAQAVTAQIDSRVWSALSSGRTARLLVTLRDQADLRSLPPASRQARAQAAFDHLSVNVRRSQAGMTAMLRAHGVEPRPLWIVNALLVDADESLARDLAARTDVARIELDVAFRVRLESPQASAANPPDGVQANITATGAPALWTAGYTGAGMVFASADTGVMWDHPALKAAYRGWSGASADHNYNWWDGYNAANSLPRAPAPLDDNGHGTHTTGIGVGATGQYTLGMAPGAKWIACRNMVNGVGTLGAYLSCLQFFMAPTDLNGANPNPGLAPDVIDNSYYCPASEGCDNRSLQAAVEAVRAAGIFFSVSAGNSGPGCETINEPPGLEPSGVTVGATDNAGAIANFSSRGPAADGLLRWVKPDLTAPGVSVWSALNNGSYQQMSGTSMAAPHVAGAVLLLWQAFPALRHDVDATERLLEISAGRPAQPPVLCGGESASALPNNTYGWGRLDVARAFLIQPLDHPAYLPYLAR